MELTREEMLERSRARDATYDGRFITGVLSTGIYCLPSCPARNPKAENVRFFGDGAGAREAGLRPCKRCRPDDFERGYDPDLERVRRVVLAVREDPSLAPSVSALRSMAGRGTTRLNDLFRRHLHRTPGRFLLEARLDAARERLAIGDDRAADVAFEVGFESLSAFNDAFRRHDGCAPTALRGFAQGQELELDLPAGFRTAETLAFLGRHPDSPTERVEAGAFTRAVWLDDRPVPITVRLVAGRAIVAPLGGVSRRSTLRAYDIVRRLLGLEIDPAAFERTIGRDPGHGRLLVDGLGLRVPQTPTVFEAVVWSLVGQQVTVRFAATLRERLVRLTGTEVDGLVAHPRPRDVARVDPTDLRVLQFSRAKAEALVRLASLAASGDLPLESLRDGTATDADRSLQAQSGIGPWSAAYVMMRGCAFSDCVPVGDSGLAAALQTYFGLDQRPSRREVELLMAPFAPHRTLATTHFWRTLSTLPGGMA